MCLVQGWRQQNIRSLFRTLGTCNRFICFGFISRYLLGMDCLEKTFALGCVFFFTVGNYVCRSNEHLRKEGYMYLRCLV